MTSNDPHIYRFCFIFLGLVILVVAGLVIGSAKLFAVALLLLMLLLVIVLNPPKDTWR